MEIKSGEFNRDIKDAFDYWKSKQEAEQVKDISQEKWVISILQKPIYDLLGQKRIEEA